MMGEQDVDRVVDEHRQRVFMKALLDDLRALEQKRTSSPPRDMGWAHSSTGLAENATSPRRSFWTTFCR
jgi:hypothetical protein